MRPARVPFTSPYFAQSANPGTNREQIVLRTRGIKHVLAVSGQSFLLGGYGSNFGSMFVIMDDFEDRHEPELYADDPEFYEWAGSDPTGDPG